MKMYSVEWLTMVDGMGVLGPALVEWEIKLEGDRWTAIGGGHHRSVKDKKELYWGLCNTPREAWMQGYKGCDDSIDRMGFIEAMYDWCMKGDKA